MKCQQNLLKGCCVAFYLLTLLGLDRHIQAVLREYSGFVNPLRAVIFSLSLPFISAANYF